MLASRVKGGGFMSTLLLKRIGSTMFAGENTAVESLEKLVSVLKSNTDTDPKYNRVREILTNGVEGKGPWKDKGCILFTQCYDSAFYVAERAIWRICRCPCVFIRWR